MPVDLAAERRVAGVDQIIEALDRINRPPGHRDTKGPGTDAITGPVPRGTRATIGSRDQAALRAETLG